MNDHSDRPRLLTPKQIGLLVLAAIGLSVAAGPLLGWLAALGTVLSTVAGILLAVALAETWIHHREQQIAEVQRKQRRKRLGEELLIVAGGSAHMIALAVLRDAHGRKPSEDAAGLRALIAEVRRDLAEAETVALSARNGYIHPEEVTDGELEEYGLPSRERMRWCAESVTAHLELSVHHLPSILLNSEVSPALDSAVRYLITTTRVDWGFLANQDDPYPATGSFLAAADDTLRLCSTIIEAVEDTVSVPLAPPVAQRKVADTIFTTWDRVRERHRRQ
jgi:hypothetical protein